MRAKIGVKVGRQIVPAEVPKPAGAAGMFASLECHRFMDIVKRHVGLEVRSEDDRSVRSPAGLYVDQGPFKGWFCPPHHTSLR